MNDHQREIAQAVKDGLNAGLSVIWPNPDGSKRPDGSWKEFQARAQTRTELLASWGTGRDGLMVVCGPVSGGLTCMDFESEDIYALWRQAMALGGYEDLLERLEAGYLERCPRGGFHLLYRCQVTGGNRKLAFDEHCEVLIETRGSGGCFMAAPTCLNGSAWTLVSGGFPTIAQIDVEEREAIHRIAELLCRAPKRDEQPIYEPVDGSGRDHQPGRDFNRRGDWHRDVLIPAGWTQAGGIGLQEYWRRPGKDWNVHQGHSAVLHTDSSLFVPFSSSTPFPQTEMGYAKWRALAYLRFDGDFSRCAAWLRKQGYGKERERPAAPPPRMDDIEGMPASSLVDLEIPTIDHLLLLGEERFVMKGASNLLYAYPKTGKTDLMTAIVREWLSCGLSVVFLTEEPLFFWKLRLEALGEPWSFWEPLYIYAAMGWGIEKALRVLECHKEDTLVIDTVRNILGYQEAKGDEDVARVIIPTIQHARDRDQTLVALYHARKMPGENGLDISGHHSLYGAFDRAIQLKRVDGEENDTKRRLEVSGRLLDPTGSNKLTYIRRDNGSFEALDAGWIGAWEKKCAECGEEFQAKRSDAIYCTDTCRKQAKRKSESSTER